MILNNKIMSNWRKLISSRVVGFAIGALVLVALLVLTLVVTTKDDATNTETGLWTFILFSIGAALSFYGGGKSVRTAAEEVVRPQAKAASRRIITLGFTTNNLSEQIELSRFAARELAADNSGDVPIAHLELAFDHLNLTIEMQKRTIIDAIEDWRQFDAEITNDFTGGSNG